MTLTTHVLDTAAGVPAAGIEVVLEAVDGDSRSGIARATTDADGRTGELAGNVAAGWYELSFVVAPYFAARGVASFYDRIAIRFRIDDGAGHHHVPLLLSPWGYTTYRGS